MEKLAGLFIDAIPPAFWAGVVTGGVVVAILGGATAYCATLLIRHWKTVLLLCAIATAVSAVLLAVA